MDPSFIGTICPYTCCMISGGSNFVIWTISDRLQQLSKNGYLIWHVAGRAIARLQTRVTIKVLYLRLGSSNLDEIWMIPSIYHPEHICIFGCIVRRPSISGPSLTAAKPPPKLSKALKVTIRVEIRLASIGIISPIFHALSNGILIATVACLPTPVSKVVQGPLQSHPWMGILINIESHFQEVPIPIEIYPCFDPSNFKVRLRWVC